VAAVLFCLTLLSTYLVTGLFARYAVTAQSSEQARVAAFSITGAGALEKTITAMVSPGETTDVKLIINNNSEVAVEYEIEVSKETENLPLSLELKEGNTSLATATGKDKITFKDQKAPGNYKDEYDLKIKWEAGRDDVARMGMVDYIAVTVTATQID